jgi:DNA-binding HxlR family transcriptional regulator
VPSKKSAGRREKRRSNCPASFSLDLLGDRWTMLVVRDLLLHGKRRYREFLDSEEGIATNILADRLARLERWEIVTSQPDPENGRQKLYEPTARGLDLAPLLLELIIWGGTHDPDTAASEGWIRSAKRDRKKAVERLRTGAETPG